MLEQMEYNTTLLFAAMELAEQGDLFIDTGTLQETINTAYNKCPDMEIDCEIIGYMKESLLQSADIIAEVTAAMKQIDGK